MIRGLSVLGLTAEPGGRPGRPGRRVGWAPVAWGSCRTLVLPVVVAGALLSGPSSGALLGLAAGWVVDLMPPGSQVLGSSALLYAAAGLVTTRRAFPFGWVAMVQWRALPWCLPRAAWLQPSWQQHRWPGWTPACGWA